jgi:hypothetical protein
MTLINCSRSNTAAYSSDRRSWRLTGGRRWRARRCRSASAVSKVTVSCAREYVGGTGVGGTGVGGTGVGGEAVSGFGVGGPGVGGCGVGGTGVGGTGVGGTGVGGLGVGGTGVGGLGVGGTGVGGTRVGFQQTRGLARFLITLADITTLTGTGVVGVAAAILTSHKRDEPNRCIMLSVVVDAAVDVRSGRIERISLPSAETEYCRVCMLMTNSTSIGDDTVH